MTDDDYDTEPYEGQTSSPEEMRYLEQDEASAPITTSSRRMPPLTYRVRRARQQIRPLPTTLPATPTTLHVTPNVVKLDTGFTIVITAIVIVCVVAFLLKSQCHCTCTLMSEV